MKTFDLILRGGTVVTRGDVRPSDIGIAGGKIATVHESLAGSAREEIDIAGLHVLPGVIDAHVHFNEPGRAEWEGLETGSRALAAGGGTLFFDMPLNAHPPTVDAAAFDLKLAEAKAKSLTDFAFWGGIVPGNADSLEALRDRGVVGFKAFMSNSGIEDFSAVDDATLREGMKRAARLGLPVAVHAESEAITSQLARECLAAGRGSIRDYLDSRPVRAELDAIRRAIDLAGETRCALHIVHVSSGAGVWVVAAARKAGANVSCETCPHYLVLTEADVEALGAVAKCAPPLRPDTVRDQLWQRVFDGDVDTIGSDHSPAPADLKRDSNFFKVWGGISGVQHLLPLLLSEGHHHRALPLDAVARLTAESVAARFRLPLAKGRIAAGADADLALVDLGREFCVDTEALFYRHRQTPYVGRRIRGAVVRTMVRGRTVFLDGKIVANPAGNLVKPML